MVRFTTAAVIALATTGALVGASVRGKRNLSDTSTGTVDADLLKTGGTAGKELPVQPDPTDQAQMGNGQENEDANETQDDEAADTCDGMAKFPIKGKDSSERMLYREGVIDEIPSSLCGHKQGKNVILVVGDGMGWEMVRAGAVAKRVVTELEELGCDIQQGCTGNQAAIDAFSGRTLADYYTEGKGEGLSFQKLPHYGLVTTTTTVIQEPNAGNHYAPAKSLLSGTVKDHEDGMSPLALDECGFPIDFSPLDYESDQGNMVLWDNVKGGEFPWDPHYFQENPDTSGGFDPTYIMQHATDSASTAGTLATGHKSAVNMLSVDLYEEKVSTLIEDAMKCGKAGGAITSVPSLHATPAAFVSHANYRKDTHVLQKNFVNVNPTLLSGVCSGGYYPKSSIDSMRTGPMSSEWTVLEQKEGVMAENFYDAMSDLDPDNGDHLLVCFGGDFSASGESNLPYRGVDSSYTGRWCPSSTVVKDETTGLPTGVESSAVLCDHYSPEEVKQIPHTAKQVKAALDFLGKDDDGFFLMYEQGDIDWAAHANHMDDLLGTMFDIDDSVAEIMAWIEENGGWEKNALYVTADHDHYLTLGDQFPEALANFIIAGESHNITPQSNSNRNPWSTAVDAGRHEDDSKNQVDDIADFTTWTKEDIENVAHFWGARGSGGNGWGSHSTRPVPISYGGDSGCIEALTGKGFQVLGREVQGTPGKIDQMHLHACMMRSLFGLGAPEVNRPTVQIGPRPSYLVSKMKDSELKSQLETCANTKTSYQTSDFSIGHRGAALQFPEHTEPSYRAAAGMGAGIIECDVTFTKDLELVCRHSQCDLHTTTDIVTRPDLNAKCTTPWAPGVSPKCCTSDFTLEELKTVCAKMDSSNGADAATAEEYAYGGTADFRTDNYQAECEPVLTHKESIALIHSLGARFTPEIKAPSVTMPFNGFTQKDFAAKAVGEYKEHNILPEHVWFQSATLEDIEYLVQESDYGMQAVVLDFDDNRVEADNGSWLDTVQGLGAKYVAPPMYKLVMPDAATNAITASGFAKLIQERDLHIITWTLDRTGGPLEKEGASDYYWQTLQNQNLDLTAGSRFDLLDVLYKEVGIEGIFDDWAAVSAFYANCMDLKLR